LMRRYDPPQIAASAARRPVWRAVMTAQCGSSLG
jgi:hypothetical protein